MISWQKTLLKSKNKYESLFSKEPVCSLMSSKHIRAYETAVHIREFEIDLYWKRTGYFWAFITSLYVAYYYVLKELCCRCHGAIPLIVLSLLILLFSVLWLFSSYASKHWQKNWEQHVDLLEDEVTGPLYKTYLAQKSFSLSNINIVAGYAICTCSLFLFFYELWNGLAHLYKDRIVIIFLFVVICALLFLAGVCIFLFLLGNTTKSGNVSFEHKIYGNEAKI